MEAITWIQWAGFLCTLMTMDEISLDTVRKPVTAALIASLLPLARLGVLIYRTGRDVTHVVSEQF